MRAADIHIVRNMEKIMYDLNDFFSSKEASEITGILKGSTKENIDIQTYTLNQLIELKKIVNEEFCAESWSILKQNLSKIIEMKGQIDKFEERYRRFTKSHEEELNTHLNQIAQEGWRLVSVKSIEKGIFGLGGIGDGGYGYGSNIVEGFVCFWEKN
jgi:hypothetical protein